jgi:hypothetical protein
MKKLVSMLVIVLISASISSLIAQDNTLLGLDIAKAQETNRALLMSYSWQRSAKIFNNGEEKMHSLVKVWFNTDGKMESSVLSSESTVQQKRGVRGRAQQGAGEDLAALLEKTLSSSIQYVILSKGYWIDLTDMADVKVEEGVVKIDAKDLLVKGDEVHYILDDGTKLFKSITISSVVEGKSFTCSIDFKTMSDGTNHPSHTEIVIPSESIKITSENIDYIKQQ